MPVLSSSEPVDPTPIGAPRSSGVPLWALAASLAVAAGIHLAVARQHDFAGLHGTFFAAAGALQAVAAVAVARRPTRLLLALAAAGSSALVVTWLVVRTPGFPGGDALDPPAVATAVAELVSLASAIRLLARPVRAAGRVHHLPALGVIVLAAVGVTGYTGDGHDDHHHGTPTPVVAVATQNDEITPHDVTPHDVTPHDVTPHDDTLGTPIPAPVEPVEAPHHDDVPHDH